MSNNAGVADFEQDNVPAHLTVDYFATTGATEEVSGDEFESVNREEAEEEINNGMGEKNMEKKNFLICLQKLTNIMKTIHW